MLVLREESGLVTDFESPALFSPLTHSDLPEDASTLDGLQSKTLVNVVGTCLRIITGQQDIPIVFSEGTSGKFRVANTIAGALEVSPPPTPFSFSPTQARTILPSFSSFLLCPPNPSLSLLPASCLPVTASQTPTFLSAHAHKQHSPTILPLWGVTSKMIASPALPLGACVRVPLRKPHVCEFFLSAGHWVPLRSAIQPVDVSQRQGVSKHHLLARVQAPPSRGKG